ncbi:hypothetical protein V865_003381 [Kwoniella europaea PYCC6329]|uniref:Uncharacterized protein n=1 Tax=Kwoniella europaea PYCC6329 TaxID=1423913 RepID=A0AAX4KGY8_9TREE
MSSQETHQGTTKLATDDATQDATQEGATENATREADQNPIQDAWNDTAQGSTTKKSDPWSSTRDIVYDSERGYTFPSLKKIMMKTNGYFASNLKVKADKAVLPEIKEDYARAQDKFRTLLGLHDGLQSQLVEQSSTTMAPVTVHTPVEEYRKGRKIAKNTESFNLQGPYYLSDYEQERPEDLAGSSE